MADPLLRSEHIDHQRVAEVGFDVIHLLHDTLVYRAVEILLEQKAPLEDPFFASPAQAWNTIAHVIHTRLNRLLGDRLAEVLPGFHPFMIAVTAKGARVGSEIKFHHDWTYTDERFHRAIFMWCPLVDCDPGSGSLQVVPTSHRWSNGIRPSRRIEVTEPYQPKYVPLAVGPVMAAGDAIVFDPGLIHGSGPNRTDRERPAITVACVPEGATLLHFHYSDQGDLSGHVVDDDFFTTHPYGQRPTDRVRYSPWTDIVRCDEVDPGPRTTPHLGGGRS